MGQDVIQLGLEIHMYTMTFSDWGTKINGTWGTHDGDPGEVALKGIKTGDTDLYGCNIQYEWDNHNEAAYDKANRDRWRNRY